MTNNEMVDCPKVAFGWFVRQKANIKYDYYRRCQNNDQSNKDLKQYSTILTKIANESNANSPLSFDTKYLCSLPDLGDCTDHDFREFLLFCHMCVDGFHRSIPLLSND